MNEYNERVLKTVLQDYREANDAVLLQEIEEAKNDPRFQVREGEAEVFAQKYVKKTGKKTQKMFLKVASVILAVVLVGSVVIPVTVEGRKSSLARLIFSFVNSEFLAFDSNEDDRLLLSYEGEFVPSFIPDGYSVESVNNNPDMKELVLKNDDKHMIVLKEQDIDVKSNNDFAKAENLQEISILGYNGTYYEQDGIQYVIVIADNLFLCIFSDDSEVDLIGFAKKIETR